MSKLLNSYRASKSVKDAVKLRTYERSHPMAVCMLAREDADLLADAISHANREG